MNTAVTNELERRVKMLTAQNEHMKRALVVIASMADPDDIEEDDDGFTEWGCSKDEAIPMAYENAITTAQVALAQLTK